MATEKPRLFIVDKPAEPELTLEDRLDWLKEAEEYIQLIRKFKRKRQRELVRYLEANPTMRPAAGRPPLVKPRKPPA
ncbi:MAG: hypothetical protein JWO19_4487 [Bryobacterales bacterium]|nr:hypothetical protein [Bryobacterales bacterium]